MVVYCWVNVADDGPTLTSRSMSRVFCEDVLIDIGVSVFLPSRLIFQHNMRVQSIQVRVQVSFRDAFTSVFSLTVRLRICFHKPQAPIAQSLIGIL